MSKLKPKRPLVSPDLIKAMFGESVKLLVADDGQGGFKDHSRNAYPLTSTDVEYGEPPLAPGLAGRSAKLNGVSSEINAGTIEGLDYIHQTLTGSILVFSNKGLNNGTWAENARSSSVDYGFNFGSWSGTLGRLAIFTGSERVQTFSSMGFYSLDARDAPMMYGVSFTPDSVTFLRNKYAETTPLLASVTTGTSSRSFTMLGSGGASQFDGKAQVMVFLDRPVTPEEINFLLDFSQIENPTAQYLPNYKSKYPGEWDRYEAIKALGLDFFVQFEHAVYRGRQVLFRDPECTVPVTEIGNHTIGGAKDPFTLEIVQTQPNASARPLWLGPGVGARFDGIDDHLRKGSAALSGDTFSVFASVNEVNSSTYAFFVDGVADSAFCMLDRPDIGRAYVQLNLDGIFGTVALSTYPSVWGGKRLGLAAAIVDKNGTQTEATSATTLITPRANNFTIGSRTLQQANAFLDGTISWVAGFNRDTTPAEELILRNNQ